MTRSRLSLAIAIALLVFSAFMLGKMAPSLMSVEKPSDQSSFKPLDLCTGAAGSVGVQGDLMWDGSRLQSQSGVHYVTVEMTRLLYGGAPGPIGLKTPISLGGMAFGSPSGEAFTATYTAGFLFITLTFADGWQRNLTAVILPPPFRDSIPCGCVSLVIHQDQEAGILVLWTPSAEPLDNPALGIGIGDKVYQARIYAIVRV